MTTVADYISIQDSSTTMNPPDSWFTDVHSFEFDAPDANVAIRPVLMFRVNPQLGSGDYVQLTCYLNGELVVDQRFDSETHRSWHEIIEANVLKQTDNQLVVNAGGNADEVILSDLVLLYKKDI